MRRTDRRRQREGMALRRSVRDRRLVTAELRAGRCPCVNPEIETPGEHIASCRFYSLTDAGFAEEMSF